MNINFIEFFKYHPILKNTTLLIKHAEYYTLLDYLDVEVKSDSLEDTMEAID